MDATLDEFRTRFCLAIEEGLKGSALEGLPRDATIQIFGRLQSLVPRQGARKPCDNEGLDGCVWLTPKRAGALLTLYHSNQGLRRAYTIARDFATSYNLLVMQSAPAAVALSAKFAEPLARQHAIRQHSTDDAIVSCGTSCTLLTFLTC